MKPKLFLTIFLTIFSSLAHAQTNSEQATANYLESIQSDPEQVLLFLQNMPKGADLHYHAGGGASMAENLMKYGHGEHFCINRETFIVTQDNNCSKENLLDNASSHSALYNAIVNSWSMRNFHPIAESGHDHFFSAFAKMQSLASLHDAETLAETVNRAGVQNESYLELMVVPDENASGMLGSKFSWNPNFSVMRQTLLKNGLNDIVVNMQKKTDSIELKEKSILACGTPNAQPGCNIKINYLYVALREQPPQQIFAQLLAAFEIADKDPRFVGINLAQPEDGFISMRDYHLQMQMIEFLHKTYPKVHIALHAGELNSSIVPPEGLRFHIHEAIDVAHAERIGHGVDVSYETNAEELLKEMAKQHVMVEINLSSNEAILNVEDKHPLPLYISHHVPVAISTDDEGIIRTTLTLEYQKAILRYHLPYTTLKNLVRNSLYYSFMPGKNVWQDENYNQIVNACITDSPDALTFTTSCKQFLASNPKAEMQWDLEKRFKQFENQFIKKT